MNQRIEQLAIQAGLVRFISQDPKAFQKFADLIIGECVDTLYQHGWTDAGDDMKEHYGVDETNEPTN